MTDDERIELLKAALRKCQGTLESAAEELIAKRVKLKTQFYPAFVAAEKAIEAAEEKEE